MLYSSSPQPEFLASIRLFTDRRAAGQQLGNALIRYANTNPVVLGISNGGVAVAHEIAHALGGTLDVWVARRLRAPSRPELGIGAIADGPAVVVDREAAIRAEVTNARLLEVIQRELKEVQRRVDRLRAGRTLPELRGRTVILVDDGIATGSTIRAVARAVKRHGPARLIIAVPVAPRDMVTELGHEVDAVICLHPQEALYAVGLWYEEFGQVSDREVARVLDRFALPRSPRRRHGTGHPAS